MTFLKKILGVAAVATLAVSMAATSASAHDPNNYKSPGGIFPTLAGPIGAAALFPSTTTFFWTTTHPWKIIQVGADFTWKPLTSLQNIAKNIHNAADAIKAGKALHQQGFKVYVNGTKITNINDLHNISHRTLKKGVNVTGKKSGVKTKNHSRSSKNVGKAVVGCIMGSAFGAITASIRKASAMGNPPRWRSQAEHERILASGYEKQFELTNNEAHTAVALCGLGSFTLHWPQSN